MIRDPSSLAVLLALLLAAPSLRAAPGTGTAGRQAAVERFIRCLRGQGCPVAEVFTGDKALRHWTLQADKIKHRPVTLTRAELHPREPSAEWRSRWLTAIGRLARTGRPTRELPRLGSGSALAATGPDETIALVRTELTPRGRAAREARATVLFVVLWRVAGDDWRVASWECAPHLVAGFLESHRPPPPVRR